MKKTLITFILICTVSLVNAQEYKFGKVSKAELSQKVYPLDSSANAAILYKKRTTTTELSMGEITLLTTIHMRIKIYNKEGFDWATHQIYLSSSKNSDKETVYSIKAVTYNLENGKVVSTKLSKKEVFSETKSKFLRVKKFTMPNIKEGCVVEWKYTVRSPFYTSVDDVVLQYSIPVKKYEGRITLLGFFTFNKRTKGYFPFHVKEEVRNNPNFETTDKIYVISAENIPALKEEAYVNNIDNYRSGMVFEVSKMTIPGRVYKSFSHNWNDIAKNIYQSPSFGGELHKRGFIKDDVAALKATLKTDSEKIVGAFEFVKSKVKWNEYNGKFVIDGVKEAYKTGAGNTAEINLLLVNILRQLGLNANPVLLSTRDNGVPLIPTSDGLNYVIAAVEMAEGVVLLDATEPYSTPNVLPLRDLNWQGRIVREDGTSDGIGLTPVSPIKETSNMSITIDEDGYIKGMKRTTYTDLNALHYRNRYAKVKDEDIIAKIEERNENIEIENFRITNKRKAYKPLTEMYTFSSEDLIEEIGGDLYFKPLFFDALTENPFKLKSRVYPIDFGTPFVDKQTVSISIPEGYTVSSLPENLAIGLPNNYGVYKFVISATDSKILLRTVLEINTSVYPSSHYNELKEFYKLIATKNAEQIVLKKL